MIVPLVMVAWQGDACVTKSVSCLGPAYNKVFDMVFPYLMLAGGLFVGYGMKRFADTQKEEAETETQAEA